MWKISVITVGYKFFQSGDAFQLSDDAHSRMMPSHCKSLKTSKREENNYIEM